MEKIERKDFFAVAAESSALDVVGALKESPPKFENPIARQAVSMYLKLDHLITREEWDEFWDFLRRLDPMPDRPNLEALFEKWAEDLRRQEFLGEDAEAFRHKALQGLDMFRKETLRRFDYPRNMASMEKHEYHGQRLVSVLDDLADLAWRIAHTMEGFGVAPIWAEVRTVPKETIMAAIALDAQAEKEETPQPTLEPEPERKGLLARLRKR